MRPLFVILVFALTIGTSRSGFLQNAPSINNKKYPATISGVAKCIATSTITVKGIVEEEIAHGCAECQLAEDTVFYYLTIQEILPK